MLVRHFNFFLFVGCISCVLDFLIEMGSTSVYIYDHMGNDRNSERI